MNTMTTRRRDIDVLMAMSSPRQRRLRFRFRRENRRRRPLSLAARLAAGLQTSLRELAERLGARLHLYRRRWRGNAYRRNARRRPRTALL